MRSGPRLRTRLWLGALAFAGVAFAHGLTYFLVSPDAGERERLLVSTGHGYWPFVMPLALGALVSALAGFVAGRRAARAPPERLYRRTAFRLAVIQSLGFVLLEAGERIVAHASAESLVSDPFLLIGITVQICLGLASALLLVVVARVLQRFSDRPRPIRPAKVTQPRGARRVAAPRLGVASGGATLRGPPLAA
jgi:hypothetical protein